MQSKSPIRTTNLPDPATRYNLQQIIGNGIFGNVYLAIDKQASNKKVAIKIQKFTTDKSQFIEEEYNILRDYSNHANLPDFYGIFRKKGQPDEIWFVMEYCEGGRVIDLVLGLLNNNRRMKEEHIAYILQEIIKAGIYLHEKNVIHRDIQGSNILMTGRGEIKLVDFGLCRELDGPLGKRNTCIGSPCWMAPEVITSAHLQSDGNVTGYGSRADVWSIGIVAIELADGRPPYQDAHPTRAMFQIVRNPPPGLLHPAMWSLCFIDFINECLEKNPEHRPFMTEIIEHPFFQNLPENDYYLTQELRQLRIDFASNAEAEKAPDCLIHGKLLKKGQDADPELMYIEDLAALEDLTEDNIINQLRERMQLGQFQTFVGDILLILNPNERQDIYSQEHHSKYRFKSRSDNAPHIYSVADSAYQAVLHHEEPQHILLAGESLSGKTTALLHLVEHLNFLGQSFDNKCGDQVLKALAIIHALGNASTSLNPNSTRCILQTQVTFGRSGKISGAIFSLYQLEKWRISSTDMTQATFHILYYFYDAMEAENKLDSYKLEAGRPYRYLRIPDSKLKSSARPRDSPKSNFKQFLIIQQNLLDLGIEEEQIDTIWTVLAAILHLGDIQFKDTDNQIAEIENPQEAEIVADLLKLDPKKLFWALTNYCSIYEGTATKKKHTSDEARDARDMLANNLYARLVDWIVSLINQKLAYGRAVFGDKYLINILDSFGFECYQQNNLEQLFVNCFNEQMQYHYTQRVFAWEMLEQQEEHVPGTPLTYYDNRSTVDELMARSYGLFAHIDDASKNFYNFDHIIESLQKTSKTPHIKVVNPREITIAHYTGLVRYNVKEMSERNRDFLPPEIIDVMRLSNHVDVKTFFTKVLTKTGNLATDEQGKKWNAAIGKDFGKAKRVNFEIPGMVFSQTRKMRTAASIFRSASLEVLRTFAVGAGTGGTHFVRCVRSDLVGNPRGFNTELIRQQLRALSILDTAKARQKGYPHRIPFNEFLRRYKFLAFDFDENVEISKESCRLLLIRLKMEGWVIGKSKVFLSYYNEEFLARLYETQVKKIIKIQCMMRAFLARRKMQQKMKQMKLLSKSKSQSLDLDKEHAALMIQKIYRGYAARKNYQPLINQKTGKLNEDTANFIRPFAYRWKKKSMFQIVLLYRAARFQDVVNLSQQVHIFNQSVIISLQSSNTPVPLDKIYTKTTVSEFLGDKKPTVWKLPFKFDQLPYFDTSYMCDPYGAEGRTEFSEDNLEAWDAPLRWRNTIASQVAQSLNIQDSKMSSQHDRYQGGVKLFPQGLINVPYNRDPNIPINQIKDTCSTPRSGYIGSTGPQRSPTSQPKIPSYRPDYDFEFDSSPKRFVINKPPTVPEMNPIKELEIIGRKMSEDRSDDDPPFNFQGMLRKTNYNRESMKRNIRRDMDNSSEFVQRPTSISPKIGRRDDNLNISISEYRPKTPPKTIYNEYDANEFMEPDRNKNTIVYESPKVTKQIDNAQKVVPNGNCVTQTIIEPIEIIPGVVVEGVVSDL